MLTTLPTGQLDLSRLDQAYAVVIQLRTQQPGVIHQVVLRPDKVKRFGKRRDDAIIRIGETRGDEANGWTQPGNVFVMAVLGSAAPKDPAHPEGEWVCSP